MAKNAEQITPDCIDYGRFKRASGDFHGKANGQVMIVMMENCQKTGDWRAKILLELLLDIKALSGQYLPLRKRNLEFILCDLQKQEYLDFDKKSAWLTELGAGHIRKHFCEGNNGKRKRKVRGKVRGKINR